MEFTQKFKNYYKAHYPSLFILTHEEERVVKDILELFSTDEVTKIHTWDAQRGLINLKDTNQVHTDGLANSTELLKYLQSYREEDNIFILKDFHLHFDKVINIRLLRNLWNILKTKGNMLVLVGHKFAIPAEMEKEIQLIDYDLPGAKSIEERLAFIIDSVNKAREDNKMESLEVPAEIKEAAVEAAKGMTFGEIENAFAMAYTTTKSFEQPFVSTVFDEKIQQLKKNGLLTYIPSDISFDNVGGLNGLKRWIRSRKKAYSQDARDYKLPLPKGILLASVPGVGKTLVSKSIAKEFDCPLFQFDMGSIFDSHVGNSERNMREAIKVIESIGKCVILIDEIEKSLSKDAVSGKGDTGVSSRIFGTFLGWLNDRTNPAFIVATSNDHTILPTPLIRKGRFDQLFWVDLPSDQERREIFNVVLTKYGRKPSDFDLKKFVVESDEFTGAEIEDVVKSALFRAFDVGEEVSDKDVLAELAEFIPFAHSHEEDLQTMRKQARGKLVMLNDQGETQTIENAMRKLSISME
jgi:SpoVK/Ycf46/Vps4 family AAA+-type ATPase